MGGRSPKNAVDLGDGRADGDSGGGPIDPATGLRDWYNPEQGAGITWADIFGRWQLVEVDLHQLYGVDLASGVWKTRTGPWLRIRVLGLLTEPTTRLFRALRDREEQQPARARDADVSFDDY